MQIVTLALALLALGLLAAQATSAARLFDHSRPVKRGVGRRNRDGKLRRKEVDSAHMARAAFDPHYAHEEDLDAGDLGMEDSDLHDPTDQIIERRLQELFPTIDTNHDGVISAEELQRHLLANGLTISRRRAEAEWRETDTNHDGRVSPLEYLDIHLDDTEYQRRAAVTAGYLPDPLDYGNYIDVTRMAIHHADINRDGGLGREEFFNFMNPEEGNNLALKLHRLRQDIFEHLAEHDREAKKPAHQAHTLAENLFVNFQEFYDAFWAQFTVWNAPRGELWTEDQEKDDAWHRFVLLDTDADGQLTAEELLPAFAELHPTENRYARMQAEHMMEMAECKDNRLTLAQMLEVPHAFYGVVTDEEHTEL